MLREKGFLKGINFGGWLSQCDYSDDRLRHFIEEKDFATVASWGADHVRIPFDYNILENDDGTYKEEGFALIDNALELCKKYSLHTVLDLHKTAGFSFDYYGESESGFFENEKLQERFYALWEQMAKRYGHLHDRVVFELLNEVTDKDFIDAWNRISYECIRRIRQHAPDIIILVGSYWNNSAKSLPDLAAPYDDKVVYNFHCYDPLFFTHQGAYWTNDVVQEERYTFEEANITPEFFEELFAPALKAAADNHTGLYCGEYGVIDVANPEDALKWLRCINSVFEKYNIARSIWTYKEMDFGIADARMDGVREELLKYI